MWCTTWPSSSCSSPPQVVYYVASVVVLYSAEAHTQRHYRGHTEDIESICVHPQVSLHLRVKVSLGLHRLCISNNPKLSDNEGFPFRKHCVPRARLLPQEMKTLHMSRYLNSTFFSSSYCSFI